MQNHVIPVKSGIPKSGRQDFTDSCLRRNDDPHLLFAFSNTPVFDIKLIQKSKPWFVSHETVDNLITPTP